MDKPVTNADKSSLHKKKFRSGQGTIEYILLIAVIVSVGLALYRVFEEKMTPIVVNIKRKLEQDAQWGGRPSVNQYYMNGGSPYSDAQVYVDRGI